MQPYIVRVQSTNLSILQSVDPECFDEAIVMERAEKCVASPDVALMVAIDGGVVVGQCLAVLHRHPDKGAEVYIDDLAVSPSLRRQGLARALVSACREWGLREGAEALWVATDTENDVANQFYRSLGLTQRTVFMFDTSLNPDPEDP